MNRTADQIRQNVEDQLSWDSRTMGADIRVEVQGSTVVLSGTVPTHAMRKAAEFDAWAMPGVGEVENRLTIRGPQKLRSPPDEEVQWSIENALALNASLDASAIKAVVNGGAVTLSGAVDAYWKKWLAEEIALDVPGVFRVINALSVVPSAIHPDTAIARQIAEALERIGIDPGAMALRVEGGSVTLDGSVPSREDYDQALDIARHTRGVIDVRDKLLISPA